MICANCGRSLGKLETPERWQNQTVCRDCLGRLSSAAPHPARATPAKTSALTKILRAFMILFVIAGCVAYARGHQIASAHPDADEAQMLQTTGVFFAFVGVAGLLATFVKRTY